MFIIKTIVAILLAIFTFKSICCQGRLASTSQLRPQSHPTMGPIRFQHPYDFLPVRPSEALVGILCGCCSRGHIRLQAPCGLTQLYIYGWSNNSQDSTWTPCVTWAPHGNLQCFLYLTGPIRVLCGTLKQPRFAKITHGHCMWPYGALTVPARAVQGLFMISKPVRGPQAYKACITTLRAPYNKAKFPMSGSTIFFKTAWEQSVWGPGVWCD